MCTSILYTAGDHYFGRNLDLEITFGQQVVVTPRDYPFVFRKMPRLDHHYAIIGMSIVKDNYPLYFDGANEEGLGMAGLNFNGFAHFFPVEEGRDNVSPFEFIPYVLSQCKNVAEAKQLLKNLNLADLNFSAQLPVAPLHWIIADKNGEAITVESTSTGLHVYDNPVGVLTNNPEFPGQLTNLANYRSISPAAADNTLAPATDLKDYSRGLGSHLLPGGMDSESRFVKEVFTLQHAPQGSNEVENVTNYFHCLHAVEQQKGLDEVAQDKFEYTIYSDGINLTTGTFYYTTYNNNQINAVQMHNVDLDNQELVVFPVNDQQSIQMQN